MANIAVKAELTNEERKELESLRRSRKTALARRAALEASEGLTNKEAKLKMTAATAGKWCRRFAERRLDGLRDEPRPGAPRRDGDIAGMIRRTRNAAGRCPLEPALHVWSGGLWAFDHSPNPAGLSSETSPQRDPVKRSAVRREGAGRPVPRPAERWC